MKHFDLDEPLMELVTKTERSFWTTRHAVEGLQIFGGIGSGKTSGSGRMVALKYLRAGFGGLVLTVKPDEKQLWQSYCTMIGREQDLILLEPGGSHRFNFLEYVSISQGDYANEALTENIADVLKTVIQASGTKDRGKSDDAFWENALDLLVFNSIDLCKIAYGKVTIPLLYDIIQAVPDSDEQINEKKAHAFNQAFEQARQLILPKINVWFESLPENDRILLEDDAQFEQATIDSIPEARLLKIIDQFFFGNYIGLSEKTRSIIDFSVSGFLFRLLRDPVYSLFCSQASTFTPEDCLEGKIILINLPVKVYQKVGRDCQILFKYIWQRAMEKRDVTKNGRPLFLWADEAQNFIHQHDVDYQATARSSRIATVYISQNLPNYYASMGGDQAEYKVKSFMGTLATKIFHANADIETNRYASELIGDDYFEEESESITVAEKISQTKTKSLKLERVVRPEGFVRLKTGGPRNDYRVEGYLHRQGDSIFRDSNHIKMRFNQNYSAS